MTRPVEELIAEPGYTTIELVRLAKVEALMEAKEIFLDYDYDIACERIDERMRELRGAG